MKKRLKKLDRILSFQRKKYFVKSFFRKAKRLIVDFIPLDEISSKYLFETKLVDSDKTSVSYGPAEFDSLQNVTNINLFPVRIYALKNVFCTTNASYFLTKDFKHIYFEKFHDDEKGIYLYTSKNLLWHGKNLAKVTNLQKFTHDIEAIFFGGTFTNNYYHFLIEIISKTKYLNEIPGSSSLTVVLDKSIAQNSNLKTITEFFLKDYKLLFLSSNEYHNFRKLWFITSPNTTVPNIVEDKKYEVDFTKISAESIHYLRDICFKNFDPHKVKIQKIQKIFIARKSSYRKYNESELLLEAEKYGFVPVYFEDLNIHEQIFLLQNADYVIGSSGAAFTNIIFAKEGSKGLIWLGSVWGDFSSFSTLAKMVGFNLYHYRFQSKTSDFHEDFEIDVEVFEKELKKLLDQ